MKLLFTFPCEGFADVMPRLGQVARGSCIVLANIVKCVFLCSQWPSVHLCGIVWRTGMSMGPGFLGEELTFVKGYQQEFGVYRFRWRQRSTYLDSLRERANRDSVSWRFGDKRMSS